MKSNRLKDVGGVLTEKTIDHAKWMSMNAPQRATFKAVTKKQMEGEVAEMLSTFAEECFDCPQIRTVVEDTSDLAVLLYRSRMKTTCDGFCRAVDKFYSLINMPTEDPFVSDYLYDHL